MEGSLSFEWFWKEQMFLLCISACITCARGPCRRQHPNWQSAAAQIIQSTVATSCYIEPPQVGVKEDIHQLGITVLAYPSVLRPNIRFWVEGPTMRISACLLL